MIEFEDIAEVVPGVYIGSLRAVSCVPKYVDFCVNLSGTSYESTVPVLNILISDTEVTLDKIDEFYKKFALAVGAIKKCTSRGQKILVHCRAGVNRASTAIAMYLISEGYSYDEALAALAEANSKRDALLLTNKSFKQMLKHLEQCMRFQTYKNKINEFC